MRSFSLGEQVDGRYILKREIARGGGGIVFQAEHRFTTRQVALKLLLEDQQGNSTAAMRLLREARALTVARHPNIVEVLDAGATKDTGPYLVMELLEGRVLDGILATRGKLEPADSCWLVAQAAAGAAKMHRHGLVHRDIKPSNIFIRYTQDGEEAVTLLDFGAATHEALPKADRITTDNSLIGTPEYMSPEQLLGEVKPDPRMDVYSLGALLYELLLGGVPHEGTYGEILLKVHSGQPSLLDADFQRLPKDLQHILARAMAVSPDERTPSASQLADELNMVLERMASTSTSLLGLASPSVDPQTQGRRRHTRAPYTTAVTMHTSYGHRFEGMTQDLSTGGTLVLSTEVFNPKKISRLEMAMPHGGAPVSIRATGKWSRSARQGLVIGLEFRDLSDELSENIRAYVASMVARRREEEKSPESGLSGAITRVG